MDIISSGDGVRNTMSEPHGTKCSLVNKNNHVNIKTRMLLQSVYTHQLQLIPKYLDPVRKQPNHPCQDYPHSTDHSVRRSHYQY